MNPLSHDDFAHDHSKDETWNRPTDPWLEIPNGRDESYRGESDYDRTGIFSRNTFVFVLIVIAGSVTLAILRPESIDLIMFVLGVNLLGALVGCLVNAILGRPWLDDDESQHQTSD